MNKNENKVEAALVFNYGENENAPIRVQVINGETWFVAKDVCENLGIISIATRSHVWTTMKGGRYYWTPLVEVKEYQSLMNPAYIPSCSKAESPVRRNSASG